MTFFLDFIKENWRVIVELSTLTISVVFFLVKKRPCVNQIDSIKKDILEILPLMINSVETPGNGSEKLVQVVSMVRSYIGRRYHLTDLSQDMTDFIISSLESILSTPKKKGE